MHEYKNRLLAAVLLVLSAHTSATVWDCGPGTNYSCGDTRVSATSISSASNMSSSGGNTLSNNSSSGGNTQTNAGNNSSNANSVTVNGDTVNYRAQDRNPANTAYAAPLAASNGTCMGSTSGGIQGIGLGISVGSTWTDESCDMRYDAEALRAAGLPGAAQARLCQKKEIAAAMEAAGTPCPSAK